MANRIVFLIVFCVIANIANAETFRKVGTLGPIHIPRDTFLGIANSIFSYASEINKGGKLSGYVELENETEVVRLALPLKDRDFDKFPDLSYVAVVSLLCESCRLERVELKLDDRRRIIDLSGKNTDDLTGALNVIKGKLEQYETIFAGSRFRAIIFALFILFVIAVYFYFSFPTKQDFPFDYSIKRCLISGAFTIPILIIPLATPWEYHFTGFLANKDGMSIVERYGSEIIFAILMPFLFASWRFIQKKVISTKPA